MDTIPSSLPGLRDQAEYFPHIPEPAMAVHHGGSSTRSILHLPCEVIMTVFETLFDYYLLSFDDEWRRLQQAFILMHTCRYFRYIAYHTPSLWCLITLGEPAMLTRFLLARSQAVPLVVGKLGVPMAGPREMSILGDIIDRHAHHLGSLTLEAKRDHLADLLSRLLRHPCVPHLKLFNICRDINADEDDDQHLVSQDFSDVLNPEFMPNLRALTLVGPYTWKAAYFPRLTTLDLESVVQTWAASEILVHLRNMPMLQILCIRQPFIKNDLKVLEGTPHPSQIVHLAHLKNFVFESDGDHGIWRLLQFFHFPAACTWGYLTTGSPQDNDSNLSNETPFERIGGSALQAFCNLVTKIPNFILKSLDFDLHSCMHLRANIQTGTLTVRLPRAALCANRDEDIRAFNNLPSCLPSLDAVDAIAMDAVSAGSAFYAQLFARTPALTHLIVSDEINNGLDPFRLSILQSNPALYIPPTNVEDVISVLTGVAFSERVGNLSASELSALALCPKLSFLDISNRAPLTLEVHQRVMNALCRRADADWFPRNYALTVKSIFTTENFAEGSYMRGVISTYVSNKEGMTPV
ncbi:hypothetical protein HGRIS_007165 [Hohenbuehelia grisea]|uniref:F-box domain-containing protein n=1 Tax=Hohenbuehelia grisea TaxID=104357 RepID=A0ABR3JB90_9AGAR